MPIYDIAGLRVSMNQGGRTAAQAVPYLSDDQNKKADVIINVTPERVKETMEEYPQLNQDDWEYMITGSDFYKALLAFNGILLHASCVVVDDRAYAFSADCGTGKSTHTGLWLEHFGERAHILNDDKPAIRIIDNKVYACGTPWSGKYDISTPENVELAGICFLHQAEENTIKPADVKSAVFNIFSQTVRKLGPNAMEKLFDTVDAIFNMVPIFEMGCNISDEAVLVSYGAMSKNQK